MEKIVYTVDEMAQLLKIGMNKAYDLIREKRVKHIKIGRQIRITKRDLEDFLAHSA